ncbi:MAG: LamG-like jellyroll fold domain-containing protein [Armatimonadota bacterium]
MLCLLASLATGGLAAAAASAPHSQLRYHPEGEAIVTTNGGGEYNRPLYCNKAWPVVYAGDRPRLVGLDWNGVFGHLDIALVRQGMSVWLYDFDTITTRYLPGRMQWLLTDKRFPGLQIKLEAATLASGVGFTVQLSSKGAQPQDKLLWHYGGYLIGWGLDGQAQIKASTDDAATPYIATVGQNGFDVQLVDPGKYTDNPPPLRIVGQFSELAEARLVSSSRPADPGTMLTADSQSTDKGVCVVTGLADVRAISLAVYVDSITDRPYSIYNTWQGSKYLTPAKLDPTVRRFDETIKQSPAPAFAAGWKHATQIGRTVVVQSPDPYLDAQASAACSAVYGLYVAPVFTHGGSQWRCQMPGWRMLDGATAYGWHQLVKDEAKYYIDTIIKSSNFTTPKANAAGTEEASDSRYYGKGRIGIDQGNYNFQVQFFEELIRSWRHTGDKQLEAMLLPALELHLERARECFDPDDDGLYESYINTWPTDSIGYNGGGSVEESAYCYYMHTAAAEMCLHTNDKEGAARHTAQAKKIYKALHDILWLKRKGYFASYIEQGGHQRVHDDAWLYSEFLPIDLGMTTPAESIRTLHYTEWGLERIGLPYGGELCHTSNWVPSIWSVRELYGGDIYHLALSYFRMGQSDAGWKLLKGALTESGFGDLKPKAAYGGATNMLSPGGLSHPAGSIDFSDVSSMFCRSMVEGMFGYLPDYPNGLVHVQPSLPSGWDKASINTPDYQLGFQRTGQVDSYHIGVQKAAKMVLRLPVYGKRLLSVTVNGILTEADLQPWYGYGMAVIRVPKSAKVDVALTVSQRQLPQAEERLEFVAGQKLSLRADGPIQKVDDAQGSLLSHTIRNNSIYAECSQIAGHYAVMALVKAKVPYWKIWKIEIKNPEELRLAEIKNLRSIESGATWKSVDIASVANGDIRTIYKQDYASPRPATCSVRLARDGYQAWTMAIWGMVPPYIGMENVSTVPSVPPSTWVAKDPKAFGYRDELTIDAWLMPETMPEMGGRIVDRAIPGTYDGFLLDSYPGNSLRLLTANGMLSASNVLTPGVPVRVTAVYSASKRVAKLYKNGKLIASRDDGAFPALSVANQALYIGSDASSGNRFKGDIQRVVLYPRALSDAEVAGDDGTWKPALQADAEWLLQNKTDVELKPVVGTQALLRRGEQVTGELGSLLRDGQLVTPQRVPFIAPSPDHNTAFVSLWDNWPDRLSVPIGQSADAVWLLIAGSTQPLQGRIANSVVHFLYADGVEERLELVPPLNFRNICRWGGSDYNQERDGYALGDNPPLMVNLGTNCRAMLYGWRLRKGVKLQQVSLEALSQEVVVGLMGVSLMNPGK